MAGDTLKIKVQRTYKYRLYPTKGQREAIDHTLELCRWLYNHFLEERKTAYETEQKTLNLVEQLNTLPDLKREKPDLKLVYSQVLQDVGVRLDKAYQNFFRRVKNGETPGFPRFKGQNRYHSFTYPQSGFALVGNRLKLSKIGEVKVKLHRPLEGAIKICSIIHKNGKYYAAFSCEVEATPLELNSNAIGIDVGVADFVVTSRGEFVPKQDKYCKAEKRLKYLQRMVPRRKAGSNRRRKAVRVLATQHEKIANQRKDIAHKTSRKLINENGLIAHEDLQVKNMVKNHHLAKSIHDTAWRKLFQFLAYKAEEAGRRVVAVPPHHTSQICSGCGGIVPKKLSDRWHNCPHCGLSIQRDVNASRNILAIALAT